jgi:ssDNA-binding Zn-finger/Zn-ribbon topoisomerase 1
MRAKQSKPKERKREMSGIGDSVQTRIDSIQRGQLSHLSSEATLLIRTHLPALVAALEDVAEAAVRAIDRGSFETCDNEPECRDEAEPLKESQWCPSCRADAEIKAALLTVERVRAATGL